MTAYKPAAGGHEAGDHIGNAPLRPHVVLWKYANRLQLSVTDEAGIPGNLMIQYV